MHLTQSAVCGDVITRNLLSRIETGDVTPSLETLRFLADRLSLPVGYLLSDQDDLAWYQRPELLQRLRAYYAAQDWNAMMQMQAEGLPDDDETNLLLCESAVKCGAACYRSGKLDEAFSYYDAALSYAEKTVYHTETVLAEAALYMGIIAQMRGENPAPYLDGYRCSVFHTAYAERYHLISLLQMIEEKKTEEAKTVLAAVPIEYPAYRALVSVYMEEAAGHIQGAKDQLTALLAKRLFADDPALQDRCLAKTEQLAAAVHDYKAAYQYAKDRQAFAETLQMKTKIHHGENE